MNKTIEKAMHITEKGFKVTIPECEVGDIIELSKIWDGEGDAPEDNYSYLLTDCGEDGNGCEEIWINFEFELINEDENPLNSTIKILDISLV